MKQTQPNSGDRKERHVSLLFLSLCVGEKVTMVHMHFKNTDIIHSIIHFSSHNLCNIFCNTNASVNPLSEFIFCLCLQKCFRFHLYYFTMIQNLGCTIFGINRSFCCSPFTENVHIASMRQCDSCPNRHLLVLVFPVPSFSTAR